MSRTIRIARILVFTVAFGALSQAGPLGGQQELGNDHEFRGGPPPPMQPNHGPMSRAMHVGPPGRWWSDPRFAQLLGLSADQGKKMDAVFDSSKLKLIDLSAALQKEEAILEPLLAADRPDESKILGEIDRVAQARAELEKANARMLLGLRNILTQEQWKRLQAEPPAGRRPPPRP